MSNSHNVERTKCRIHKMSNFHKVLNFHKLWQSFVSQHYVIRHLQNVKFLSYVDENPPSNVYNFATIFLCICLKSIEYQGKSKGRIFIYVSLSLYKNNAYIQLLNAYSNISLICYIHIRSIISILKQNFRHLDVFPNTSKHYMHHCV